MSNNKSRTVRARHAFRVDSNGNPKVKTFPRRIWDNMPKIHQWVDGVKYEHDKMGWIEVAPDFGAPAPEPLKKEAAETAKAPQVEKKAPAPKAIDFE